MQEPIDTLDTAQLLEDRGEDAWKEADYAEAQDCYEQALAIREPLQGNHPEVARTLNVLGMLAQTQGAFEDARTFYQRAFTMSEQTQGRIHPESIRYLGDVGGIFDELGDAELARALYEEALLLSEQVQGDDHPDTALALSKLARFLGRQQQYEQAEALFERAIQLYDLRSEGDLSVVAPVLNNFGVLYLNWGRLESVLPLLHRALTIWKRSSGSDHPNTATALKNLGRYAALRGDAQYALELTEQALVIVKAKLGETHPETLALEQTCQLLQARITDPSQDGRRTQKLARTKSRETVIEEIRARFGPKTARTARLRNTLIIAWDGVDMLTEIFGVAQARAYLQAGLELGEVVEDDNE
jgi:tetratricopeptide (TPR) repeat protein